jgi:hypothetical protein
MLVAKAKITDQQLEPDDETKLLVTVLNGSPAATAKDVRVTPRLDGGACNGIDLRPPALDFGTIAPQSRATKEFCLQTKGALPRDYKVKFDLKYDSTMPTHECDEECFTVVKD